MKTLLQSHTTIKVILATLIILFSVAFINTGRVNATICWESVKSNGTYPYIIGGSAEFGVCQAACGIEGENSATRMIQFTGGGTHNYWECSGCSWVWNSPYVYICMEESLDGGNTHKARMEACAKMWVTANDPENDYDGDTYNDGDDFAPNDPLVWADPDDPDGDDIGVDFDPYPNDPDPFMFRLLWEAWDDEGDLQGYWMETDKGDTFFYGDDEWVNDYLLDEVDGMSTFYAEVGSTTYPYGGSQLGESLGTDYDPLTLGSSPNTNVPYSVENNEAQVIAVGIDSGESTGGSETDTELLTLAVNNLQAGLANDQTQTDRLKAIEIEARGIKEALQQGITTTILGLNTEGTSSETIGDGIGESLVDVENEAGSEYGDEIGEVNTFDPATELGDAEFDETDVPEKNALGGMWDTFLADNPITTALGGSGIDSTGASSSFQFNLAFLGKNEDIIFDFADYVDVIDILGIFILGMAGLYSIMIIVRG